MLCNVSWLSYSSFSSGLLYIKRLKVEWDTLFEWMHHIYKYSHMQEFISNTLIKVRKKIKKTQL